MTTIIRRFGSPAQFPGTIVLDLEAPINWSGAAPQGHFRFAKSLQNALRNRAGGANASVSNNAEPVIDDRSISLASSTALSVAGSAAMPLTFLSVFRQSATAVNQTLMGNPSTSGADSAGLGVSSGGNLIAFARAGGSNFSASLPKNGGDRWEFVAGTFDNSGGAGAGVLRLHRPRTGSIAEVTNATIPASVGTLRIIGAATGTLNQAVQGALSAFWIGTALSESQINAIYASARESLAPSGVDI